MRKEELLYENSSTFIKQLLFSLGVDLCGIACIERFQGAPKGYHPTDILPSCRSVISFGCRFPVGTLICSSNIPYTRVRNSITSKMDSIALDFCIEMEKHQILCIPIPVNESVWDENTGRWRSIVSLKHAAQAAGLGTIGRHSLLITPEFGSMIWLGAVLCESKLEPDDLKENICDHCNLCVNECPVNALEDEELRQQTCWDYAFGENEHTKVWQISCHKCRDVCPYNLGTENKKLLEKGDQHGKE
ncbi:MAG TPA: 4Fe-4S binding protein [Lachnospiraceae bacterium]|nr:4Fe-4S binding protein [Lachnospiraceae bacterium]